MLYKYHKAISCIEYKLWINKTQTHNTLMIIKQICRFALVGAHQHNPVPLGAYLCTTTAEVYKTIQETNQDNRDKSLRGDYLAEMLTV